MQKILIRKITIKNSPVFKEEVFYPDARFNVFSGASGAGKSVLMESVLALFGLRECNAEMLEAVLEIEGITQDFKGFIDEGEITLTLTKKDKVRYFLNAQNIPKKKIQELFAPFLKHLSTKSYDATSQKNLFLTLDGFIVAREEQYITILKDYQEAFAQFQDTKEELRKLENDALRVAELKEFVAFEIQKLESINPKKGEYEELLQLKKEISKKEKIAENLQEVQDFLNQSHKVFNFLNCIDKKNDLIVNAFSELESLCAQEREHLESLSEVNPENILNRIEELSALNKRYGGIDEALAFLDSKKQELQKYENLEEILKQSKKKYKMAEDVLKKAAESLSNARLEQIKNFEKTLNDSLSLLKMSKAKVLLHPIQDTELYSLQGAQMLEITLNTELKNLSAGEFNRFRLALLLTQSTHTKHQAVIILDEVDANLSGEESQGVAAALRELAENYQVFAISHQPHMPSLAHTHFLIQKQPKSSHIILLDKEGRIQEIARMISGNVITQEAIEFATKQLSRI